MNTQEAAERANVPRATIRVWIHRGHITATKNGWQSVIDVDSFERWMSDPTRGVSGRKTKRLPTVTS